MESGKTSCWNRSTLGPIAILVVDADTMCLSLVSGFLKSLNYEVVAVKNASEAFYALQVRRGRFDLIVADFNLPDMNGFELLKKIRQEFQLPLVFMSVDGDESIMLKGLKSGASLFLVKPPSQVNLENLWQFVVLNRKRSTISKSLQEANPATLLLPPTPTNPATLLLTPTRTNPATPLLPPTPTNPATLLLPPAPTQHNSPTIREEASPLPLPLVPLPQNDLPDIFSDSSLDFLDQISFEIPMQVGNVEDTSSPNATVGNYPKELLVDEEQRSTTSLGRRSTSIQDEETVAAAPRKPKMWTKELHSKFLEAVGVIGLHNATPKKVAEAVNVPGLTTRQVASHLQTFRKNVIISETGRERAFRCPQQKKMTPSFMNHGKPPKYPKPVSNPKVTLTEGNHGSSSLQKISLCPPKYVNLIEEASLPCPLPLPPVPVPQDGLLNNFSVSDVDMLDQISFKNPMQDGLLNNFSVSDVDFLDQISFENPMQSTRPLIPQDGLLNNFSVSDVDFLDQISFENPMQIGDMEDPSSVFTSVPNPIEDDHDALLKAIFLAEERRSTSLGKDEQQFANLSFGNGEDRNIGGSSA